VSDIVPKATAIAVDLTGPTAGRLTADWHNALRRALTNLQRQAIRITETTTIVERIVTAISDDDGSIPDFGALLNGKQDHSSLLDQLAHLSEVGLVMRTGTGFATVEVADLPAGGFIPTLLADDATFTIPADMQALFAIPIDLGLGTLDVAGDLVEVA
jgi:hypothetical protein